MSPTRSGSGSGSGSQTHSPSSDSFSQMYGATLSLYSQPELYGQIVVYGIWALVMLLQLPMARRTRAHLLQGAMFSFLIVFALHCTRYGLLLTGSEIFPAYRYESSVIVLFSKVGLVALFAAALPSPSEKLPRIVLWVGLVLYAPLGITYVVYDFLISFNAVQEFKADDSYGWKLTDRDFGLTLTQAMLDRLDDMSYEDGFWIQEKMYDVVFGAFHAMRTTQIKIGVAADYVAALLALYVLIVAVLILAHTRLKGTVEGAVSIWLLTTRSHLTNKRTEVAFIRWSWSLLIRDVPGRRCDCFCASQLE
jgi:hypothetical protein